MPKTPISLAHPNIVQYYGCDWIENENVVIIFMEFVDGGSLGALVRKLDSALEEATAAGYIRQVLLGVEYLHKQRIIHRDLKCDNLLLSSRDGAVKVSDFGTSRRLGTMAEGTTATGTPLWMAPEARRAFSSSATVLQRNKNVITFKKQALPEVFRGRYAYAADVWSVGICLCELLAQGRPPWPRYENMMEAMYTISRWQEPLPPDQGSAFPG
eukprot:gene34811-biopygen40109